MLLKARMEVSPFVLHALAGCDAPVVDFNVLEICVFFLTLGP